jgi:hypothetical protein
MSILLSFFHRSMLQGPHVFSAADGLWQWCTFGDNLPLLFGFFMSSFGLLLASTIN